ncbi:hypothetical protein [Actinoplanes regularis]|uniref:Uncharacterized protein n=1 Tax=Actinoplanes regularis TaxID=52697 RepID=A0A238V8U7_9ACTN|nr:hypothetical protein [Actinoplanes regularis]GIE83711.1 hypothetical protein Are01nite_01910 [Actinoplanes regularis]SNR30840.1 hypothetical protein SAMN06264365_101880 [Actinoplanes regularis]
MNVERSSLPAVARVMTGWLLFGAGLLNLATGVDGTVYVVFHVTVTLGGVVLLTLHRIRPGRTEYAVATLVTVAGFGFGLPPVTTRCCLAGYPERHGFPFPFLGTGDGMHADLRYLGADLVFWACAGLVALAGTRAVERRLPERRVPVELAGYLGWHGESHAYAAQHRTDENVGGLT